ncbi:tail assembly protein [Pluralibacter gergoviae]|uniref:Tail assembly protein n=1 Tax=Pluralibacter gergoviae TaxID=61647 RepID=A0AAW8HH64_PLUGE|nr:tail assembly protein [Pluralibacter gergoviae]AVR03773.1 phage tail protein [Pluralibacter gergoviae]EKW6617946.1 tail assembly protein [Pluralibacter gergoviae]EKW9974107.1 tail assembly protein [Pluralibacter gergoviae]EKZ9517840.1 tail assembly protein [Pluralibacter gergoviae]ELC3019895.1 tail assembly protein [Pluralibacter gergoviae]
MQEVMTTIILSGQLGKEFGRKHNRLISRVSDAAVSLAATIDGFRKFMSKSEEKGLTFAVFKGDINLSKDELDCSTSGKVIRIVPVIIGSKKAGLLQTIAGAVLITVGAIMTYMSGGTASPLAAGLMTTGFGMMAGGVIQMLSPQPSGISSKQDSDNKASYAFGSVTNTTAQGNPVPLGYGKRRIGGAIISAGIYVEDQQ